MTITSTLRFLNIYGRVVRVCGTVSNPVSRLEKYVNWPKSPETQFFDGRLEWYFVSKIVLTYCEKKLF